MDESELYFETEDVTFSATAECAPSPDPDAPDLAAYPLLVYAATADDPEPKVRLEDTGTEISRVIARYESGAQIARIAAAFGSTAAHVFQAVEYVMATRARDATL